MARKKEQVEVHCIAGELVEKGLNWVIRHGPGEYSFIPAWLLGEHEEVRAGAQVRISVEVEVISDGGAEAK